MQLVDGGRERLLLALFVGIAVLDRITKWLASERLPGSAVEVIPNHLQFSLVHNSGIAFGMLDGADFAGKPLLLTALSAGLLVAIVIFAVKSRPLPFLTGIGLAAMLAGAASNIADRVALGYVVDFIDMYVGTSHWPTYNVADAAISCGVVLMLLDGALEWRRARRADAAG